MKKYKLLSGETVRLDDFEAHELAFLKNLERMAKSRMSFFEIERVAIGPGSPALRGWSRLTWEIAGSALYRVASDIATRAGITEGLVLAPEHENKRTQIPADRSLMSVTQAANTLGVSRAAVHKAIQQKRLAAQRYGNVFLVTREQVLRHQRERVRAKARGQGAAFAMPSLSAKAR